MRQRNRQQGGLPAFGMKLVQERRHGVKDLAQSGALTNSPGRAAGARSHDEDRACFPGKATHRPGIGVGIIWACRTNFDLFPATHWLL